MLRVYLEKQQVDQAVQLASHYKNLVFFAHVLEVLIHTVLEMDEAEEETEAVRDQILDSTVEFLDYFDQALEVIVGCARKTEMARWERLFNAVGSPKMLFEVRSLFFVY
jgi:RAB6A-GEF complex partner protein 1